MPKKLTTNPKALESRERKEQKKFDSQQQKQKQKEDAFWKDDDKNFQAKQQRQQEKEQKRLEELQRRQENKDLYDKDLNSVENTKPMRGEVLTKKELKQKQEEAQLQMLQRQLEQQKLLNDDEEPEENDDDEEEEQTNTENQFEEENDDDEDDLQALLYIEEFYTNKNREHDPREQEKIKRLIVHPERKAKSSWRRFMKKYYKQVVMSNSDLTHSQILEILRKDWKVSNINPFNRTYKNK